MDVCHLRGRVCCGLVVRVEVLSGDKGVGTRGGGRVVEGWVGGGEGEGWERGQATWLIFCLVGIGWGVLERMSGPGGERVRMVLVDRMGFLLLNYAVLCACIFMAERCWSNVAIEIDHVVP